MNETEWLVKFFTENKRQPEFKKIESIKNFTILWNLFERYFCDTNASLTKIQDEINKMVTAGYTLPKDMYDEPYAYFCERYLSNNKTNEIFELLDFRDTRSDQQFKDDLKATLESKAPNDVKKTFACLIIIYRFRNNLFHGSKNIATISDQEENFKVANTLLMKFLDFLKRSGKLSYNTNQKDL